MIKAALAARCAGAIDPRQRPFAVYDATISYQSRSDTIPTWVSIVVPFVLMLISLFIGEFILFKKVSYVAVACGSSACTCPLS